MHFLSMLAAVEPTPLEDLLGKIVFVLIIVFGTRGFFKKMSGNTVVKGAVKSGASNLLKRLLK